MTGDFSQTNTCGSSVDPASSCTFNVVFAPTATGSRSGSLTITDNAPGSPHSVALTGIAIDFTLEAAPGGATSATVAAGATANYNLEVSPVNGFATAVSFACADAPAEANCTISPSSATPNGASVPITVSVTAAAAAFPTASPRIPPQLLIPFILLALAAFTLALHFRQSTISACPRRLVFAPACALLLFAVFSFSGCGSSSTPKDQGTPKGTYSLTLTGTANGVIHQLGLKLTVN
jgi:hypothetical protein